MKHEWAKGRKNCFGNVVRQGSVTNDELAGERMVRLAGSVFSREGKEQRGDFRRTVIAVVNNAQIIDDAASADATSVERNTLQSRGTEESEISLCQGRA